ncbi:MAG: Bax inhibitor-1/YccA family protein [Bacteroidales bacterium]|nr:Bax inhibitor-1/YccA family protein [Bacteroidales bacterium]MBN2758372.1 Bax inhibitor-1/YccA family protein [Bacteroidales bacterium]
MRIGQSSNPALSKNALSRVYNTSDVGQMTINGTVNKTILSLLLVMLSAYFTWKYNFGMGIGMVGAIVGFILAMVTVFKSEWAHITTPFYAIFEGLFLGSVSAYFNAMFSGIVFQAVGLTFGVAFAMLFAYRSGLIKATPKFQKGIIAATGGIAIFYILNLILGFFGGGVSLANMGLLGIGIQLVIVGVAALNLILDFDMIEKLSKTGAPKVMEWYGAFGLLVTLVWLYFEILKLLSLLSNRD